MKANHILFSTLAVTLISAYNLSPNDLQKAHALKGRLPASVEEKQEAPKAEDKKIDNVQCKAESKGEKLEKELKALLEDKEDVIKEIKKLRDENKDLKDKLSAKPRTKEDNDGDTIALMSQLTSLLSVQMQAQMDMQMQMMSMFSQMQFNQAPQYTWDISRMYSPYGIHENWNGGMLGLGSMGVGLSAPGQWPQAFQNPYSQLPQMTRQPAQQSDFGFFFDQIPQANNSRGFDFNLAPSAPLLPQMNRQQIPAQAAPVAPAAPAAPFSANTISV